MIYTITFNPALDYVVHLDQFQTGQVNRSQTEELFFGGKGINVSVILKQLGLDSVALGFIAGFTGQAIKNQVEETGVITDFISLPRGNSRINVKIKTQEESEINANGPMIPKESLELLFQKLDHFNREDILILAGSIPSSLPDDIYEQIIQYVAHKELRIVVDATKNLLWNVLKYKPFLIKPNNHELGELFGVTLTKEEDLILYAKKLQEMGAQNVLVSRASKGALLVAADGNAYTLGVPKGEVKNSVGAGDSMVAGFLAGYLIHKDYEQALRWGTACGSATAFSLGLANKEKIDEMLQQI